MEQLREPEADYYADLSITRFASTAEIKKAYRRLVLIHHPDKKAPGQNIGAAEFRKVQTAYDVLSDASQRCSYDWRHDAIQREWVQYRRRREDMRRQAEVQEARNAAERERKRKRGEWDNCSHGDWHAHSHSQSGPSGGPPTGKFSSPPGSRPPPSPPTPPTPPSTPPPTPPPEQRPSTSVPQARPSMRELPPELREFDFPKIFMTRQSAMRTSQPRPSQARPRNNCDHWGLSGTDQNWRQNGKATCTVCGEEGVFCYHCPDCSIGMCIGCTQG